MIPEKSPVNTYSGNGATKTFDFNFYIENEGQLVVYHTDKGGVQVKLTLGTDYSINAIGNENGSYITFPIAGSSYPILKGASSTGAGDAEKISLCLNLKISQESEYGTSGALNLQSLEYSLDYLTRLIQIQARLAERSIKIQEGSVNSPDELINEINTKVIAAQGYAITAEEQSIIATNQATIATAKATELSSAVELVKAIGPRGQANGYAPLDGNGVVPKINLPVVDLSGKSDVDFSNVNNAGKSLMSGMGMPSSRFTYLTLKANGETYIAPANGYYLLEYTNQASGTYVNLYNTSRLYFGIYNIHSNSFAEGAKAWTMCKKGDVIGITYYNILNPVFRFIYAEGAKND